MVAQVAQVEQKHWWIQYPFSWAVEVVLVLALLASVAVGVAQVRGRDATIAEQAAGLSQQDAAIQLAGEQMGRMAAVDGALFAAYGLLPVQLAALAQARRGESGEVYESAALAEAAVVQTQSRIADLMAQRQRLLGIGASLSPCAILSPYACVK